jgi:hypothetical protein
MENTNTLEKYHIYKISKTNLHVNNTDFDTHNLYIQNIARNERQLATHVPYLLYKENQLHETSGTVTHNTKANPTHRQNISNITTTVIQQHYINKTLI